MLKEGEARIKSSWELLREQSQSFWLSARQNGDRTRFGHPDELAEHVVFKIASFLVNSSENIESTKEEIKTLIRRGRYSEVIDRGQILYITQNGNENVQESPSLIKDTLGKIFQH